MTENASKDYCLSDKCKTLIQQDHLFCKECFYGKLDEVHQGKVRHACWNLGSERKLEEDNATAINNLDSRINDFVMTSEQLDALRAYMFAFGNMRGSDSLELNEKFNQKREMLFAIRVIPRD